MREPMSAPIPTVSSDDLGGWEGEILAEIHNVLAEVLGERRMKATPPMMYPEAIMAAIRRGPPQPGRATPTETEENHA